MEKPKFNKRKCLECKYHSTGIGYPVKLSEDKTIKVHCNYSGVKGQTCLKRTENGIIDRRGNDYYHCKLYEKGKAVEEEMKNEDSNMDYSNM